MASGKEEWSGEYNVFEDPEELRHLHSVLDSFRQYRRIAHFHTTHARRQSFYALPTAEWTLLSQPPVSFLETLARVDEAIATNADLAEAILDAAVKSMGIDAESSRNAAEALDIEKARSTLHQLYRDWSAEGESERKACYGPVLSMLTSAFPNVHDKHISVLVPGAGLGRLVFELASAGFHAEGNEISYHQLIASSFVLNHTTQAGEWALHPFALSFANVRRREEQLRKVMIPDRLPRNMQSTGSMGMSTGDFCSIYGQKSYASSFDAVATVFFIDTTRNVIRYIETVKNCLKTGGLWVNLGPLLWHFAKHEPSTGEAETPAQGEVDVSGDTVDDRQPGAGTDYGSFELSDDEVVALVEQFGFAIETHEPDYGATGYVQNPGSMLQSTYRPSFWAARKI